MYHIQYDLYFNRVDVTGMKFFSGCVRIGFHSICIVISTFNKLFAGIQKENLPFDFKHFEGLW